MANLPFLKSYTLIDQLVPYKSGNRLVCFTLITDIQEDWKQMYDLHISYMSTPDEVQLFLKTRYPDSFCVLTLDLPLFIAVLNDMRETMLRIYDKAPQTFSPLIDFGSSEEDEVLIGYINRHYPVPPKTFNRVAFNYPGTFLSLVNYLVNHKQVTLKIK